MDFPGFIFMAVNGPSEIRDIGRYPPCLVAREQVGRRPPSGLGLEIHVSQRVPVVVANDEAASVVFFDVPRWRFADLA